nr:hypothetical protein [uncultured Pseudomonas sp.]
MEALFYFLVEVLLYGKGYWSLRLLSIDPRGWSDGLVSLVGLMVTLAWLVPLLLWMTGNL